MDWVSLHSHSTFSFLDGYGQPRDHVERIAELGMPAVALTEHGNVSSHVQLAKAATEFGIKPIYGLEAYTAPATMREDKFTSKWHLGILAMDQEGYANLMALVTESWEGDNFYSEATVLGGNLADHSSGLAVLSGCTGSKLATDLVGGKKRPEHLDNPDFYGASRTAAAFRDLLGDRYFIEVQAFPELDKTGVINPAYERIARELGIPLVATCDVHYPLPSQNKMQQLLHATGRGGLTMAMQGDTWEYNIRLTYPKTDTILLKRLMGTGLSRAGALQAISNSASLAESCNVSLPRASPISYPGTTNSFSTLMRWIGDGWKRRGVQGKQYKRRLKREIALILDKDFVDFFLVTADAVMWAKSNGIAVGPARGSAAASLVCYLLGITEIDPMRYPAMMLERFLDPSRSDTPDIDLDFDDARRDEIRLYLVEKYGAECVGNVMNFVRFRGKSSVNAVGHAEGIPRGVTASINELLLDRGDGDGRQFDTVLDTIGMYPVVEDAFAAHPELRAAIQLEGQLRGFSVHAAGLIVASSPLTSAASLYAVKSGSGSHARDLKVLSVDKWDADYMGFLKMDFLGLTTMGMLARACELAGISLPDLYDIPDDDKATMDGFRRNDVTGIFQFEGRATKAICGQVKPDRFMELADINALSRPGPLGGGMTAAYIKAGRNNRNLRNQQNPAMYAITQDTRGQVVYQEQILRVSTDIGGFDWATASKLRKIISKKLGQAQFNSLFEQFAEGANRLHGMDNGEALRIWKTLVSSAAYAFNVAHSVSYAKLALWCMYMKQHYPAEFFTASLHKTKEADQIARLLRDANGHGIVIGHPSPESSGITWDLDREEGHIYPGYQQIPGIGEAVAASITEAQTALGGFTDWGDLLKAKGVGPKTVEKIQVFANSEDPFNIYRATRFVNQLKNVIATGGMGKLPMPTHNTAELQEAKGGARVVWSGLIRLVEYRDLAEDERAAGNTEMKGIRSPHLTRSVVLKCTDDGDDEVYVRIGRFDYRKFAQQVASITPGVDGIVVSGTKIQGFGASVRASRIWVIEP